MIHISLQTYTYTRYETTTSQFAAPSHELGHLATQGIIHGALRTPHIGGQLFIPRRGRHPGDCYEFRQMANVVGHVEATLGELASPGKRVVLNGLTLEAVFPEPTICRSVVIKYLSNVMQSRGTISKIKHIHK
jgi:hypothetical protein